MPPSYLTFHALFLAPPVAVLALLVVVRAPEGWAVSRELGLPVLVVLALAYTTPWDNYLIARGVWWYGDGTVAARAWLAPAGEYVFIAVQPVLTGLWLSQLSPPDAGAGDERTPTADAGTPDGDPTIVSVPQSTRDRLLGAAGGATVGLAGVWLLGTDETFYLGAILTWAAPVLAVQWALGWPYLWRARRTVALAVAAPTAYLWLVDRIAIQAGLWRISAQYTTGLTVVGLPVEEATFFLATNLFVVQGLLLVQWGLRREPDGRR